MDILNGVTYSAKPAEVIVGPTGIRYRYDIVREQRTDEEETVRTVWVCNEYWFPTGEYEQVQGGTIPGDSVEWEDSPELHKIFRNAQHRRTDDLYNVAYRSKRSSATPDVWTEYITALDEWNEAVSALASTFSTKVPELPEMP